MYSFSIFDFFPNTDAESLIWSVLRPFHDGLEEWDQEYNKHLWIMHSIISQVGVDVNAIMADSIDKKPLYEVATQLSLYRIYEKVSGSWNSVSSQTWVNELGKRFEHHCPPGWIIQGLTTLDDFSEGDELWKFTCGNVDWVTL